MDFYAVAATLSPVLLIALTASLHGQWVGATRGLRLVGGGFVLLPATVAMLLSLYMLRREDDGGWERTVVLYAVAVQLGASLYAVVRTLWADTSQSSAR